MGRCHCTTIYFQYDNIADCIVNTSNILNLVKKKKKGNSSQSNLYTTDPMQGIGGE